MDTISDADYYVISLFQNGSYRSALLAYSELPTGSTLPTLYAARAHLALSPPSPSSALSLLSSLERTLDTRALTALANFISGDHEGAIEELEEVQIELGEGGLEDGGEGRFVRGVLGTVWWLSGDEGRREEAVEILHEAVQLGADQECLGILTHLYQSLFLPQRSLALLTSPQTIYFTSDSLQSQLFTARTNLSLGPKQRYEQAYYVYEEIKGLHGGRGESTLAGVAVSQACLGRWDEAVQAILEGLEMNPNHPTLLADFIALARYYTPNAQDPEPLTVEKALASLQALEPTHPFVVDLKNKSDAFDEAARKFGKSTQ